ncbi:MAG TPA: hypothetical protein VM802_10185 [Chitinophaga sp.]|uniref:hypothetical protein n=1 Tax=Chitinophaga sp. TaxID=1869181 RepID=UPI002B9A3C72|nr:hypothetical protein [Chitinophaga sp.]HVI45231.1 hypothetical protein [Chitinophaga sp.]
MEEELTLKEKLQYGLVGIIVIGGAVIIARRAILKDRANREQRLTYIDGNPATYAKQIKMAFDNDGWWGTDVKSLRTVVRHIPSKQVFKETMDSYAKLYNRSMMSDMQKELKSTEYNEMLAIINVKPERNNGVQQQLSPAQYQSWAIRLKAAFDMAYGMFPGTDEAAIKAVFIEIPTQSAFEQVGRVYRTMYGNDLKHDLRHELEFWEYPSYMQIIYNKPKV